jgi:hypothetical protein
MRLYLVAPQFDNTTENGDTFIAADTPQEAGRLYRAGVKAETIVCPDAVPKHGKLRIFQVPELAGRTAGPISWDETDIPVFYV